jgi:hypothetical protein
MQNTKSPIARWKVAGLVSGLMMLVAALLAPTAQAAPGDASALKGTWIGTYEGFNTKGFESGQEKIVITKVRGTSATGTWQYRPSSKDKWSKARPVNLSVYANEVEDGVKIDYISGADELGIYVGKLNESEGLLQMAYSSQTQDLLVLTFEMRKRQ